MTAAQVARLLATASSGAVALDAEGRVGLLNDAARRLLDLPTGDPIGRPVAEVLRAHPALARILAEAALSGVAGGDAPASKAEIALVVGGRERSVGFTVHPTADEDGRPMGALVLLRELSQIETSAGTTLARERLAAVGAMAAAIAHEMRNPLAGIRLSATMLKRRLAPPPAEAGLLDEIIAEVRRLEETVNRCLTYLRPVPLETRDVDVNLMVRQAVGLCEPAVAAAGGRLEVDLRLTEGLPPVLGDLDRLREAIANLVTNAIEAMRGTDGRLSVVTSGPGTPGASGHAAAGVAPSPATVTVAVTDTGPGIEPDILDKIFYPFFTTKPGGSGVGLATVQKIVTGHGGCVEVSSEPGRGASFRIVLPASPSAAARWRPAPRPKARAS